MFCDSPYLFIILTFPCLCPLYYMSLRKMVHIKCRGGRYPFAEVERLIFPDDQVPWDVKFLDYNPPEYNSKAILNKPWADPPIGKQTCLYYLLIVLHC